jgi:hypothetical protein
MQCKINGIKVSSRAIASTNAHIVEMSRLTDTMDTLMGLFQWSIYTAKKGKYSLLFAAS